jgi:hypothetical protein
MTTTKEPLAKGDGLWRDYDTGDVILLIGGTVVQRWKATGDIDIVSGELAGDLLRHNGTSWERFAAKTSAQVVAGDGTDPVSAPIGGDVAAAMNAGTLELSVDDLTITDEAQGDVLTYDGSNWARIAVADAGAGAMLVFDGANLQATTMGGEGAVSSDGTFTAKHPVQLHLRIPSSSGRRSR